MDASDELQELNLQTSEEYHQACGRIALEEYARYLHDGRDVRNWPAKYLWPAYYVGHRAHRGDEYAMAALGRCGAKASDAVLKRLCAQGLERLITS